jgi:hypothetical protein
MHCNEESEMLRKKFRKIGIPVEEVGKRIATLNKILEVSNMAIGAESTYNVNYSYNGEQKVNSVTLTVYMLEEEKNNE